MKRTIQLVGILIASAAVFVVSGCGQGGQSQGEQDGTQEIEIAVTHYPTVLHTVPYQVGQEQGFFEEEGIKINRIVASSGGGTTVRNVLGGELSFGDVAGPAAIQSYVSGAPVTIVSSTVPSVADIYGVTTKDSSIQKPEDLRGKKIAFSNPGSNTQIAMLLSLEGIGIDPSAATLTAAGGLSEGLTLLKEGGVDAAPLLEPVYSAQKDDYYTIFNAADYVSKAQATALITSPQIVEENPELVKGFINAYQKSADWISENPEEAGKIWAQKAAVEDAVATSAVKRGIEVNFWDTAIYPEALNNTVKGMRMGGVLEQGQEINWDELLNQSQLPEDKRADISSLDSNK